MVHFLLLIILFFSPLTILSSLLQFSELLLMVSSTYFLLIHSLYVHLWRNNYPYDCFVVTNKLLMTLSCLKPYNIIIIVTSWYAVASMSMRSFMCPPLIDQAPQNGTSYLCYVYVTKAIIYIKTSITVMALQTI